MGVNAGASNFTCGYLGEKDGVDLIIGILCFLKYYNFFVVSKYFGDIGFKKPTAESKAKSEAADTDKRNLLRNYRTVLFCCVCNSGLLDYKRSRF
jgi:POT family proton-dependent oligopeptide transporter